MLGQKGRDLWASLEHTVLYFNRELWGLVFQMCPEKRSQLDQNKVSVEQNEALHEGVCCKLNLTVINRYHRFFFFFYTFSPLYLPIINLHF